MAKSLIADESTIPLNTFPGQVTPKQANDPGGNVNLGAQPKTALRPTLTDHQWAMAAQNPEFATFLRATLAAHGYDVSHIGKYVPPPQKKP